MWLAGFSDKNVPVSVFEICVNRKLIYGSHVVKTANGKHCEVYYYKC